MIITLNTPIKKLNLSVRLTNTLSRNNITYVKQLLETVIKVGIRNLSKKWIGLGSKSTEELIIFFHTYKHLYYEQKARLTPRERATLYRQLATHLEKRQIQRDRLKRNKGFSSLYDNPVLEDNLLQTGSTVRKLRKQLAPCYKQYN